MDILILGNGFDLAHGLKTKYSDFLDYCVVQLNKPITYKPSNPFFTNMWIRHFLNKQKQLGNTWIDLEKEIYNIIRHIAKLSIMNTSKCYRIFTINFDDTYFNFYDFDKYTQEVFTSTEVVGKEYVRTQEHNNLSYYIYFSSTQGIINFLYDQLREFTNFFEHYLLDEVLTFLPNEHKYQLSLKSIGVQGVIKLFNEV